ncbi:MAG TPA: LysR substrate-binding domain-containing protein [Burkholderiaceae bacterium]|nr:LysR substrate-binding domain-containing protein [Burkholderiaceae bacterium]
MARTREIPLLPTRLKMRQMALLLQLEQKRSIVHAADAIGISQPAASKLLAELEDALGVRLYERHARGVEPTWYGEILTRHLRSATSEIRRAEEEISALKSGLAGTASIGTVVTPATSLVPLAVAELKRHSPRVLVRIERDHSDVLVSRLLAGALDLAVARVGDTSEPGELDFVPLGDEPQSVIARSGHPLARKRGLRIADLAEQAWILPPAGTALRVELDAMFLAHGLVPPLNVVEATSLVVALNLLQLSDMLVSLPQVAVRPFCKAGLLTVLPIEIGVRMDSFGIVTRKGRTLSPGAQALLAVLQQQAARVRSTAAPPRRAHRRR